MRRFMIMVSLIAALAFSGCSLKPGVHYKPDGPSPRPSYKNLDHVWFSWFGYKNPTVEDVETTKEQNWWGKEIPYIPAT
jgi:hypothetical protein